MKNRQVEEHLQRMMTDEVPDYWDGIRKKLPGAQPEEFTIVKKQSRRPVWITAASAAAVLALVMTVTLQGGRLGRHNDGTHMVLPGGVTSAVNGSESLPASSAVVSEAVSGSTSTSSFYEQHPVPSSSAAHLPTSSVTPPNRTWTILDQTQPDGGGSIIIYGGNVLGGLEEWIGKGIDHFKNPIAVDPQWELFGKEHAYFTLKTLPSGFEPGHLSIHYPAVVIDYSSVPYLDPGYQENALSGFALYYRTNKDSLPSQEFLAQFSPTTVNGKVYYINHDRYVENLVKIWWQEQGYSFVLYTSKPYYQEYLQYCNVVKVPLPDEVVQSMEEVAEHVPYIDLTVSAPYTGMNSSDELTSQDSND